MRKKLFFVLVLTIAVVTSCNNSSQTKVNENTQDIKADSTQTAAVYQCPMDCEKGKTYDKPGKCPVCQMDLEKIK